MRSAWLPSPVEIAAVQPAAHTAAASISVTVHRAIITSLRSLACGPGLEAALQAAAAWQGDGHDVAGGGKVDAVPPPAQHDDRGSRRQLDLLGCSRLLRREVEAYPAGKAGDDLFRVGVEFPMVGVDIGVSSTWKALSHQPSRSGRTFSARRAPGRLGESAVKVYGEGPYPDIAEEGPRDRRIWSPVSSASMSMPRLCHRGDV